MSPIFAHLIGSAAAGMAMLGLAASPDVYTAPAKPPAPVSHATMKPGGSDTIAPAAKALTAPWPYTDFGKPGAIVSRHEDPLLGTITIVFATGSRLIVKPTKLTPGTVAIDIALGNGRAGAPASLANALWATALAPIGGTAKLSYADLDQWQQHSGTSVNVTLIPGIGAYHLQGEVAAADLETEMQLLTAYVRDAGFRTETAEKIANVAPMMTAQIQSSPSTLFLRAVQEALLGADSRYAELPGDRELAATTGTEIAPLLAPAFAGPADVTIVGDVDPAAAIAAAGLTIAAGADRLKIDPAAPAEALPVAPGTPIIVRYDGSSREAWYGAYWPLSDYKANPRGAIIAEVAAALVQARLLADVSAAPGFARPVTRAVDSLEIHGGGAFGIALQIKPDEAPALAARLQAAIRRIGETPIAAEDLKNVRMMVLAAHSSAQRTNSWWLARLSLVLRDPALEPAMAAAGDIATVTAQDVQTFLRRAILAKRPIVVEVLPEAPKPTGSNGHIAFRPIATAAAVPMIPPPAAVRQ